MKKLKALVCRALYILITSRLPSSWAPIGGPLWKKLRGMTVRGFVTSAGKSINIQRKVELPSRLTIGEHSGIGRYAVITGPVTIGKYVNIGEELRIVTQNHCFGRTDIPMQQQGVTEEQEVVIGDDVWIGHRVMLLPGVHIGNGCVIAAGAVVTKDIPDYSVAGGVPARVIRSRKPLE